MSGGNALSQLKPHERAWGRGNDAPPSGAWTTLAGCPHSHRPTTSQTMDKPTRVAGFNPMFGGRFCSIGDTLSREPRPNALREPPGLKHGRLFVAIEQRRPAALQVPAHVVGQQAKEDVSP